MTPRSFPRRFILTPFLLPCLVLGGLSCATTEKSSIPDAAREYPLTMRADLAGAESVPDAVPGDPLMHVALWDRDGNELISGMFDTSRQAFVQESIFLFGMLPEELESQAPASISTRIDPEESEFLLRCSDPEIRWLFVESQGPESQAESTGREQALLAFGGIVALLRAREAHLYDPTSGADPCEPLEDKDYCTWSPEFFQDSCCKHDECYAGCQASGVTRLACDTVFRDNMREEASAWTRPFVPAYYGAVRAFGDEFFPCE